MAHLVVRLVDSAKSLRMKRWRLFRIQKKRKLSGAGLVNVAVVNSKPNQMGHLAGPARRNSAISSHHPGEILAETQPRLLSANVVQ